MSSKFKEISRKEAIDLYNKGEFWRKALEDSGITRRDLCLFELGEEYPNNQLSDLAYYSGGSTKRIYQVKGLVVYNSFDFSIVMANKTFDVNHSNVGLLYGLDVSNFWFIPDLMEAELIRKNIATLVNSGHSEFSIDKLGYFIVCKQKGYYEGDEKYLGTYSGQMYDSCPDEINPKQVFIRKIYHYE